MTENPGPAGHGTQFSEATTVGTGRANPRRSALNWLAGRIRSAGDRLFHEDDTWARQHGWLIETRYGGLSRSYRDHRFDNLARCTECRGSGPDESDRPCRCCSASGRIMLGQQSVPEAR